MIILSSAINYSKEQVEVFWNSLIDTGYSGDIVIFANECEASKWLKDKGAMVLNIPPVPYPINSSRYLAYRNFLRDVDEPVIITDIRDVVFQKNPDIYMPKKGINVFEEELGVTIMRCSANTAWMNHVTPRWRDRQVICSGVTSGILENYCTVMWDRLKNLQKIPGIDQAVHMDIIYSNKVNSTIHKNEEGEVYTLAYVPYKTINTRDEKIINKSDKIPCMVHQYDRHDNLENLINKKWLKKEIVNV